MKKILLLLVVLLVGCDSKTNIESSIDESFSNDESLEEIENVINDDRPFLGGYTEAKDRTVTDELREMFDLAFDGYTDGIYEPLELIATQVVGGTKYRFLCSGSKTADSITKGLYCVTIFKDLDGSVFVFDIETIEENSKDNYD